MSQGEHERPEDVVRPGLAPVSSAYLGLSLRLRSRAGSPGLGSDRAVPRLSLRLVLGAGFALSEAELKGKQQVPPLRRPLRLRSRSGSDRNDKIVTVSSAANEKPSRWSGRVGKLEPAS